MKIHGGRSAFLQKIKASLTSSFSISAKNLRKVSFFPILSFPLIVAILDNSWLVNKQDIDIWFYSGYFEYFNKYWSYPSPSFSDSYYGTRVPYTLVGIPFFRLLGPELGHIVLAMLLFYLIVYLMYKFLLIVVDRHVALISITIIVSDPYFYRLIGSDYVDRGVLLFFLSSLHFLFLGLKRSQPIFLHISAFSLVAMISTHLMSILILPFFFAFAWTLSKRHNFDLRHLIKSFSISSILGIILFQLIFMITSASTIFYLLPSLLIPFKLDESVYSFPLSQLVENGWWLLLPLVSLILMIWMLGRALFQPFEKIWVFPIATHLVTILLIAVFFPGSGNVILSRDGLYSSFLMPISIFTFAIFLQVSGLKLNPIQITFLFALALFLSVTSFQFSEILGVGVFDEMINVALILTILFSILHVVSLKPLKTLSFVFIIVVISIGSIWIFDGDETIYKNHESISNRSEGKLPYFFFDKTEVGFTSFQSLAASFTDKAWWRTGQSFPDCNQTNGGNLLQENSYVVVLSRQMSIAKEIVEFKECYSGLKLIKSFKKRDKFGEFTIYEFKTSPDRIFKSFSLIAKNLPGITGKVVGDTKVAVQNLDNKGILSYGPYVKLDKGRYRVTFFYESSADQMFDFVANGSGNQVSVPSRVLPRGLTDNHSHTDYLEVSQSGYSYEFRTFFDGTGVMKLKSIQVTQLN